MFELQFAREVLYVHPQRSFPNLLVSSSAEYIWFYNVPYLAYLVALTVDCCDRLDDYWATYFGEFPGTTAAVYHVWKFHALPADLLRPPISDPGRADIRPNKILQSSAEKRREMIKENRFTIVPGVDYSGWFNPNG